MCVLQKSKSKKCGTRQVPLKLGLIAEAAMNGDACGQRRSVPTILSQSAIHSWPQNCFTAS
jgi:hypothetical protein